MATISLCCIAKNEAHNLPVLFKSIEGCFDELILVDTGSTDDTVEIAKQLGFKVFYFEWVNDFSKARNFSFSKATSDYIMWMDLDDSLSDANAFRKWRDEIMPMANYWLATYNYGFDEKGQVACAFARERVIKRSSGYEWKYFVHEGIAPVGKEPAVTLFAPTWAINHRRTAQDLQNDKGRNIGIFERQTQALDARMQYYYGKELFENKRALEGYTQLVGAMKRQELDHFDRILCIQYAAVAALTLNQHAEALDIAIRGLQIAPTRAEFFSVMGDSLLGQMRPLDAIPYYRAAKSCKPTMPQSSFGNPIFTFEPAYDLHPTKQIARCLFMVGDVEGAIKEMETLALEKYDDDAKKLLEEFKRVAEKVKLPELSTGKECDDVVISCPPQGFYEWDEHIYETLGCGGSETAAIEMARNIHRETGRKVIIFNNRTQQKDFGGVSYRPASQLMDYMGQHIPKVHISWRHTDKVTHAKTYVWCHDLFAQGIEHHARYDYVLALSEFHKSYLRNLFNVPEEKIIVTRNGINPARWEGLDLNNKKEQVVFTSSPDRGLDRALEVMDLVVKEMPHVEFRAYYGFDNMLKMGKQTEVDNLKRMIANRPWASMVGNLDQETLTKELAEAKVWLYPTNFAETFCISALEAVCSKVYPVVRHFGALPHTMKGLPGDIIHRDCVTFDDKSFYAERVIDALVKQKWREMNVSPEQFSWNRVAREWCALMGL